MLGAPWQGVIQAFWLGHSVSPVSAGLSYVKAVESQDQSQSAAVASQGFLAQALA